jgi:hypothetical protein
MRVVKEIPHPQCKITIYSWNNRYLVKFESGFLEQTYKIDQTDVANEEELNAVLDPQFIQQCLIRFSEMATSLNQARHRAEQ